jgi:hypothetical protein
MDAVRTATLARLLSREARTASGLDVPLDEHSRHCVFGSCVLVVPATVCFDALASDTGVQLLMWVVGLRRALVGGTLSRQLWYSFGTEHALLVG